jgi:hypothetical protein
MPKYGPTDRTTTWSQIWAHSGSNMAHFESILVSFWVHVGPILGPWWVPFGIHYRPRLDPYLGVCIYIYTSSVLVLCEYLYLSISLYMYVSTCG